MRRVFRVLLYLIGHEQRAHGACRSIGPEFNFKRRGRFKPRAAHDARVAAMKSKFGDIL